MSLHFLSALTLKGFNYMGASFRSKGYQILSIFSTEKQRVAQVLKEWEQELDKSERNLPCKHLDIDYFIVEKYASDPKLKDLILRVSHKNYAFRVRGKAMEFSLKEGAEKTIKDFFIEFKKTNPFHTDSHLSEREEDLIKKLIVNYPGFAQLLINSKESREKFFKEVLYYNFPLDVYVEFPALHTQLKNHLLDKRIAFFNREGKEKILEITNDHRDVTLLVEGGRKISLLKEEDVQIKETSLKVSALFQEFLKKRLSSGKYEMGEKGVHEIDVFQFAKGIVEKKPLDFLKAIPLHMTMTKEEIEKKYGKKLEAGQWGFSCNASRESPEFTLAGTHAFGDILVPAEKMEEGAEEGTFKVYSFGLFAEKFPEGFLEMMGILGVTLKGAITCFDENNFRLDRQRAFLCEPISEIQGLEVIKAIQEEIKKQKEGNVVFQLSGHNCACFINNIFEKALGKEGPYTLAFNDYTPVGPLKVVFSVGKFLSTYTSEKISRIWYQCVLLCLGAKRKYNHTFSVFSHLFDREKLVGYHPVNLFKNKAAVSHNGFIEV